MKTRGKWHQARTWPVVALAALSGCDASAICLGNDCASDPGDPNAATAVSQTQTTTAEVTPTGRPTPQARATSEGPVEAPPETPVEAAPNASRAERPSPSTTSIGATTFVTTPDPGYSVVYRDYGPPAPAATSAVPASSAPSPAPSANASVEADPSSSEGTARPAPDPASGGSYAPPLDALIYIPGGSGSRAGQGGTSGRPAPRRR